MTDWTEKLQAEQAFLHEQIVDTEHKIARYTNALDSCHDCQEADSLRAMLHTAQEQRDLLTDLLAHQSEENALSLGSLLAERITHLENEAARLLSGWHRGHSVSPTYWELENKRLFLVDVQRRYHAWESDRPYFPPVSINGQPANGAEKPPVSPGSITGHAAYLHPWYLPVPHGLDSGEHEAEEHLAELNAIQKTIYELLHQQGFPDNHLKVTAQPDGSVFVMGYVHSEEERERVFKISSAVEGVRELLAGIQVVDQAHCPVCTGLNQTG